MQSKAKKKSTYFYIFDETFQNIFEEKKIEKYSHTYHYKFNLKIVQN